MRIVIYSLNYSPEPVGIGKYSGELGSWLSKRGHDVRAVTSQPYFPQWKTDENRYRREMRDGVDVWRCPIWVPKQPKGLTRLLHLASFAISSLAPILSQSRWKPDLVICVAPAMFCAVGAIWLGQLSGRRTATWLHIQDYELDAAFQMNILKGRLIRHLAEKWESHIVKRFDRVSSISDAMGSHAIKKGVSGQKIRVFPNWIDIRKIYPMDQALRCKSMYRKELGLAPDHTVLLYSGSMNKKQGLEILVECAKILEDRKDIIWVLAGEGPGRNALLRQTKMEQVRLVELQPANRLNEWLNTADIHLLPQRAEATDLVMPSKLLGMLASGRPVVATSPKGSTLGLIAEEAGCRVDPSDVRGFADAIIRLTENKDERLRLGEKARQIAEVYYDKDHILSMFEEEARRVIVEKSEPITP